MYVLFYLVRDGTSFLSFHYDGKRVVELINLRALEGREVFIIAIFLFILKADHAQIQKIENMPNQLFKGYISYVIIHERQIANLRPSASSQYSKGVVGHIDIIQLQSLQ